MKNKIISRIVMAGLAVNNRPVRRRLLDDDDPTQNARTAQNLQKTADQVAKGNAAVDSRSPP